MAEKCCCCGDPADLARGTTYRDPGFRKVVCAGCGKEFSTDIPGKTCCFECEKTLRPGIPKNNNVK